MKLKRKIKVAVLDSGLDTSSSVAQKTGFKGGLEVFLNEYGNVEFTNNSVDDIGHGTAVASLIDYYNPDVEILPIKIVRDGIANSTEILISALSILSEKKCCDIVNISAGIISCDNIGGLLEVCKKLVDQGVIIVAAHDSEGAVSYPAVFDCVIGVDGFGTNRSVGGYYVCGSDVTNYITSMREMRLPWLNNTFKTVSGTSFIAPWFTAHIAKLLENEFLSFDKIVKILEKTLSGQ